MTTVNWCYLTTTQVACHSVSLTWPPPMMWRHSNGITMTLWFVYQHWNGPCFHLCNCFFLRNRSTVDNTDHDLAHFFIISTTLLCLMQFDSYLMCAFCINPEILDPLALTLSSRDIYFLQKLARHDTVGW